MMYIIAVSKCWVCVPESEGKIMPSVTLVALDVLIKQFARKIFDLARAGRIWHAWGCSFISL
jgi:hypothetical protein